MWFSPIIKARLLVTAEVAPKLNLLKPMAKSEVF
jgi:hypothetical protein